MSCNVLAIEGECSVTGVYDWETLLAELGIDKQVWEIKAEDIENKELDTEDMWESFYIYYSKLMGFSYRKDDIRKYNDGTIYLRRWVCSREGKRSEKWLTLKNRKRRPKSETRCGCLAALRVGLNRENNKWTSKHFLPAHNHDLASPAEVHFLRSHRVVSDGVISQVKSMRRVGIRTFKILDFIAQESGGQHNLEFQQKDVYNKMGSLRRHEMDGDDAQGALGYLSSQAMRDPNEFYCIYEVDVDSRRANIFWADGTSRRDYACFGEVLAFDTTYRTNKYEKPLLILLGVNHHHRTCVYGFALLCDETVESFVWVLERFLDAMGHKMPTLVITDGDLAMRNAILKVFPDAIHRLCGWHLETNAEKNVKDVPFTSDFQYIMYGYFSEAEFEEKWANLVESYDLHDSFWAQSVYEKKYSWAETYLHGNFFAGCRTTQRCESMNSYIRRYVNESNNLREFVASLDILVSKIRYMEMEDDFNSRHTTPQLPIDDVLLPFYKQVASAFTRAIYDKVAKELHLANAFTVRPSEDGNVSEFVLTKFQHGNIRHKVLYYLTDQHLRCTCLLFETDGYPCRHIFAVMKSLNITRIPPSLIKSRWRKDAKGDSKVNISPFSNTPIDILETARFGTLNSDFNALGYYACKNVSFYREAREELARLTKKFKDAWDSQENMECHEQSENINLLHPSIVRDPLVARTKGSGNHKPQRGVSNDGDAAIRKCRLCQGSGHDKRNCPLNPNRKKKSAIDSTIGSPTDDDF